MIQRLLQHFQKISPLTPEEIEVLTQSTTTKNLVKGDFLEKEGQLSNSTYFVLEGCVRQFQLVDGNAITTNFFTEEQWIISLDSFDGKKPASHSLVCMEDTSVVIGNEEKAQQLFQQFPRLELVSRRIMEAAFAEQQKLLTSYITDKPEQRYLKLLEARPDIFQRVPQYDIATYIGVKPESLSRLRRKLLRKS